MPRSHLYASYGPLNTRHTLHGMCLACCHVAVLHGSLPRGHPAWQGALNSPAASSGRPADGLMAGSTCRARRGMCNTPRGSYNMVQRASDNAGVTCVSWRTSHAERHMSRLYVIACAASNGVPALAPLEDQAPPAMGHCALRGRPEDLQRQPAGRLCGGMDRVGTCPTRKLCSGIPGIEPRCDVGRIAKQLWGSLVALHLLGSVDVWGTAGPGAVACAISAPRASTGTPALACAVRLRNRVAVDGVSQHEAWGCVCICGLTPVMPMRAATFAPGQARICVGTGPAGRSIAFANSQGA